MWRWRKKRAHHSVIMPPAIQKWWADLVKAGAVPPMTKRVVIDIRLHHPIMVYYSSFGGRDLFDEHLGDALRGAIHRNVDTENERMADVG